MADIMIAPATGDEREWAAGLMAESEPWITLQVSLEQCRTACCDPEYLLYIAHLDGKPCGVIVLQRRGVAGSPYVKSIAVSADYRDCGIGDRLMEFAEDLFRGKARHIFLCVSSFNARARRFYERRGFQAVGEFKDYIVEGASEILMHKDLR